MNAANNDQRPKIVRVGRLKRSQRYHRNFKGMRAAEGPKHSFETPRKQTARKWLIHALFWILMVMLFFLIYLIPNQSIGPKIIAAIVILIFLVFFSVNRSWMFYQINSTVVFVVLLALIVLESIAYVTYEGVKVIQDQSAKRSRYLFPLLLIIILLMGIGLIYLSRSPDPTIYIMQDVVNTENTATRNNIFASSSSSGNSITLYQFEESQNNPYSIIATILGVAAGSVLDFDTNENFLVAQTSSVSFGIWALDNETKQYQSDNINLLIHDIRISGDGQYFAISGITGDQRLLKIYQANGTLSQTYDLELYFANSCENCNISRITWTQDDRHILYLSQDSNYLVIPFQLATPPTPTEVTKVDRSRVLNDYHEIQRFELTDFGLIIMTDKQVIYEESSRVATHDFEEKGGINGFDASVSQMALAKDDNLITVISLADTQNQRSMRLDDTQIIQFVYFIDETFLVVIYVDQSEAFSGGFVTFDLTTLDYDPEITLPFVWALFTILMTYAVVWIVSLQYLKITKLFKIRNYRYLMPDAKTTYLIAAIIGISFVAVYGINVLNSVRSQFGYTLIIPFLISLIFHQVKIFGTDYPIARISFDRLLRFHPFLFSFSGVLIWIELWDFLSSFYEVVPNVDQFLLLLVFIYLIILFNLSLLTRIGKLMRYYYQHNDNITKAGIVLSRIKMNGIDFIDFVGTSDLTFTADGFSKGYEILTRGLVNGHDLIMAVEHGFSDLDDFKIEFQLQGLSYQKIVANGWTSVSAFIEDFRLGFQTPTEAKMARSMKVTGFIAFEKQLHKRQAVSLSKIRLDRARRRTTVFTSEQEAEQATGGGFHSPADMRFAHKHKLRNHSEIQDYLDRYEIRAKEGELEMIRLSYYGILYNQWYSLDVFQQDFKKGFYSRTEANHARSLGLVGADELNLWLTKNTGKSLVEQRSQYRTSIFREN